MVPEAIAFQIKVVIVQSVANNGMLYLWSVFRLIAVGEEVFWEGVW